MRCARKLVGWWLSVRLKRGAITSKVCLMLSETNMLSIAARTLRKYLRAMMTSYFILKRSCQHLTSQNKHQHLVWVYLHP